MSFLDDVPASWTLLPDVYAGGISWLPIPRPRVAPLLQLCEALHRTEYEDPQVIVRRQLVQAGRLVGFAKRQSAYYRASLADVDVAAACGSMDAWRSLPLLARADIQAAGRSLFPARLPAGHRVVGETQTSGSTGQPVAVRTTNFSTLFFFALSIRDQVWHRRDITRKSAVIRASGKRATHTSWGGGLADLFRTGPLVVLPFVDVAEQLAWFEESRAHYLLTYPSNLQALLNAAEDRGMTPDGLVEVRTIGETLSPGLRRRCEQQWSVKVTDLYSSQEVGNIAIECPHSSGCYHVMGENLIVEVLRDDGEPCRPGEVGRIVVTDLHNFATPLIRYDIRDYAEVGEPCPCGRGLATLTRIFGRYRNMLKTPEGGTRWPLTGFHGFRDVVPVRQYRFVQKERDLVEATLVVDEPLLAGQREALERVIRDALEWKHRLILVDRREPLTVGAHGKFEDFVSLV